MAAEVQAIRFPDLVPLNPTDLVEKGFNADGTPKIGTSYRDLIALIAREPTDVFIRKQEAMAAGDYSFVVYHKEVLVRQAFIRAEMGDQKALDWLADREEGKVVQGVSFVQQDTAQKTLADLRGALGMGEASVVIEGVKKEGDGGE